MASYLCALVGFHNALVRTRGHPELAALPSTAHLETKHLQHLWRHSDPLSTVEAMNPSGILHTKHYSCHRSDFQDAAFVRYKLAVQTDMGHTVLLPWADVRRIPGLWIILVGLTPQEHHPNCLIYD